MANGSFAVASGLSAAANSSLAMAPASSAVANGSLAIALGLFAVAFGATATANAAVCLAVLARYQSDPIATHMRLLGLAAEMLVLPESPLCVVVITVFKYIAFQPFFRLILMSETSTS